MNIKYIIALLFGCFVSTIAVEQKPQINFQEISIPAEIMNKHNQFSGLYIHDEKLFLMSESRLDGKSEAKLYAISISDLQLKMANPSYVLPYEKYPLLNLDKIKNKIESLGEVYEGLEAIVIDKNDVYLFVETKTSSPNCYLLKGHFDSTKVIMDTSFLHAVPKPLMPDGAKVYNAGFEAMLMQEDELLAFFEYNYFPAHNYVYRINKNQKEGPVGIDTIPISKLPFRITDITHTDRDSFMAINYFYKGKGGDEAYRTPEDDPENSSLIKEGDSYHSYCRLVEISLSDNALSWKTFIEFPEKYWNYNWEGIAAYDNGYFIINDFYSDKPNTSVLLYLERVK